MKAALTMLLLLSGCTAPLGEAQRYAPDEVFSSEEALPSPVVGTGGVNPDSSVANLPGANLNPPDAVAPADPEPGTGGYSNPPDVETDWDNPVGPSTGGSFEEPVQEEEPVPTPEPEPEPEVPVCASAELVYQNGQWANCGLMVEANPDLVCSNYTSRLDGGDLVFGATSSGYYTRCYRMDPGCEVENPGCWQDRN